MFSGDGRLPRGAVIPLIALALALALATGAAACGDSGDGDGRSSSGDATVAGDEQQIRDMYTAIRRAFISGDGEALCSRLTPFAQRQMRFMALKSAGSCEESVAQIAKSNREFGARQDPAKIVALSIEGDRAVATVHEGDHKPFKLKVVRQGGEWKLPSMTTSSSAAAAVQGG